MSVESVVPFFRERPDIEIIKMDTSSATIAKAAEAHGVEPGRIAKTLSLRVGERTFLVATRSDIGWTVARSRRGLAARPRCWMPSRLRPQPGIRSAAFARLD
jgi:hypothetical protein